MLAAQGDHKKAEYLELHPFGKVPAVKCEDGTSIFESGAILMYLADKNGALTTAEQRGAAAAWVLWANATFAPAVFSGGPSRGTALKNMCVPLNARLAKTPFLLGDAFTVADVAVGAYLAYTTMFFPDTKATFKARAVTLPPRSVVAELSTPPHRRRFLPSANTWRASRSGPLSPPPSAPSELSSCQWREHSATLVACIACAHTRATTLLNPAAMRAPSFCAAPCAP